MTSTQITGARVNFMDALNPVSNTSKSELGDFKSFLNFQNNKNNLETISQPVKSAVKENETPKETLKSDRPVETEAKEINQPTVEKREVESDDVDAVKDAVTKVIDEIKEELHVTDEDIIKALEVLGLTPVALLNPENLTDFVVEVTEIESPVELTTNEDLLEALNNLEKDITEVINDLCRDLGIEVKDFTQAVERFRVPEETVEIGSEEVTPSETDRTDREVIDENQPLKFETEIVNNKDLPVIENETPVKADYVKENKLEAKLHNFSVHTQESNETQTKPLVETSGESKEELFREGDERPSDNILSFAENLIKETVTALNDNQEVTTFTTVDATKIINQITESIRTEISNEATEINMKLHPESLGNVNVKITANNEGLLTARFIAENESVKSVIEAQAVSLKETLESKGVTVEAIEVMVGSHRYDESFSRERGNNDGNAPAKKSTRRINLDDEETVDGTDEEIQAENLAKDIMRQNGNSIDYTA